MRFSLAANGWTDRRTHIVSIVNACRLCNFYVIHKIFCCVNHSKDINSGKHYGWENDIVISGTVLRKACRFHSFENLDHFALSLDMADTIPSETETSTELLIGNDYYLDIILSQK